MKNLFLQVCLVCMYLFTSNTFLHAGVMAHDMLAQVSEKNDVQPCHEATHSNESPKSGDCFEQCMGLYDDFGGLAHTTFDDSDNSLATAFVFLLDAPGYSIKIPVSSKIDPPPPMLVGYGCIGKDVEKIE